MAGASILCATIHQPTQTTNEHVWFLPCRFPEVPAGSIAAAAHDEFSGAQKVSPISRGIMVTGFYQLRRSAAAGMVMLAAVAGSARGGDDASSWDGDARGAVRLIAGSSREGASAPMPAGIEIRLGPGWHTYWRYPGDAGVPPRFDFAGSRNVKAVTVLGRAPKRIREQGLSAIGYTRDVILPLLVVPQDRAQPTTL